MRGERTRAADGRPPWRARLLAIAVFALAALAAAVPVAGASSRSFEIDRMEHSKKAAEVYKDKTASGKKAIVLDRRTSITLAPRRFGATRIGVWARTRECHGPARVKVYIDGRRVLNAPVQSGPWKEYGALVNLPVRRHRVKITFPNPRRAGGCVRLLRLDRVTFSRSASEASPHDWRLVFDDEFDGTTLDQTKWNPANWQAVSKFYDPNNVIVQDGMLRLRASAPNRSGMIQTLGKMTDHLRAHRGVDPHAARPGLLARVLAAHARHRPGRPRDRHPRDVGDRPDRRPQRPVHDLPQLPLDHVLGRKLSSHSWVRGSTDYTAGFHRFAVEWEPGVIRWYIDGVETKEYKSRFVADTPMFLIFSLQIGHAPWLGPEFDAGPTTPFPSYMDIEYLRIYQR